LKILKRSRLKISVAFFIAVTFARDAILLAFFAWPHYLYECNSFYILLHHLKATLRARRFVAKHLIAASLSKQAGQRDWSETWKGASLMLYLTLREGDYFMVGDNVKVTFERKHGSDTMFIGVDAPRDVPIMRSQIYEDEVAKMAAEGNAEAKALSRKLQSEHKERQRKYNTKKASRAEFERRILAGEIKGPK
jgi:sRNA-binding carbon storage regulator CsrA